MKFKKMMPTKKQIVILLLFLFGFCTIPLPAFCDSGAVGKQSIGELRQRQQEDLDRLKSYYDDLARKHVPKLKNGEVDTGSSEYKSLEKEYLQAHKKLREAYLKKDPRLSDFQAGNEISGIKSTGSKPRDVRADVDWTAETPEAMEAKRRQWEQRGDVVVDKGHKIVNQTTDETLWKPGSEPGSDGLVHDGDAHGTQGGREAVTRKKSAEGHDISGDGIRDAEGAALDHEKKYLDAKERNNLKDQAKTAVKSADDTGRTNDVIDQARELKNYGDEITSKISHLGEDPNQRADKVKEFQEKLDAEMDASMAEGRRKGQQTDQLRKKIADSARKAENTGDAAWDEARKNSNYDNQNTTSEAVENHRNAVAESNKKTKDEIARRKSETDPVRPDTDTPDAAKKTHINDKTDKKRVSPPDPPALIKKKLSETNRQDSAANKQADDNPARSLDNAGSKEAAGSSPGRSKAGQVADGFNTADDAIQIIEMGTTIVEGIQQEDAAKTVSPVVGQDTAKRVKMEKAQKWADLEGKAEEIKKTEVSSELEAKLRRMGASKDEARDARNKWDKGDVKGFRDDVAKIKSRGRKDTAPRGLSPDSAIEEEDGVLDRLKEGGKQAGRYVDGFYGGINERTQKSVENRNELNSVQENIQGGIQDEIDNELIKKMMQKGVPYKKARDALNKKRSGDSRAWNNLRDNLPGRDNPSAKHDGKGLSADGKTQSYETGNLTEDWKDNALKEAEQKGKTILKPIDMIAEWQEANHLEEMRDNERAAEFYKALRKWGAGKQEALEAARAFAETGDRTKSGEIYQKYLKENLEKREQDRRPNEHKDSAGNWACNTGYHRVNGKCVPEPEPECRSDAQCDAGYVCENGKCVSPFDSGYDDYTNTMDQRDSDRGQDRADQVAADQSSQGGRSGFTAGDMDQDIASARDAVAGKCRKDSQCPPGYVCRSGQCVEKVYECSKDSDCDPGYVCSHGECVSKSGCSSDADCTGGKVCKDGKCVDPAPTPTQQAALVVSPGNKAVVLNETVNLKAMYTDTDGSTKDVTGEATWSPSASFSSGEIGVYPITVTYNGLVAGSQITVVQEKGMDDITVNQKVITVTCWDSGRLEDGDMIDILINGKVVFPGITLTFAKQSRTITMNADVIVVGFKALNEGSSPPNTASVTFSAVTAGKETQKYSLKKHQSANMNVTYKP
jgi:hypothetical protein